MGTFNASTPWEFSGGLTLANNGLLYGMTQAGGNPDSGTIYSFDLSTHAMQMVFQFNIKGGYPNTNELIQLSNGLLYGGTFGGNPTNTGCLFSFNPANNMEKVLVTFQPRDTNGDNPVGRLVQDLDNGFLYGVTYQGGDSGSGVLFSYDTATNTYTKLLNFTGANGAYPEAGLTLVKDTSVHVIKDSNTGISTIEYGNGKVKVYPNPNNGSFTLLLSNVNSDCNVEIYNVLGERVYQAKINSGNTEIGIGNQPQGVYLYRVISETGNLIGQGKVVIE